MNDKNLMEAVRKIVDPVVGLYKKLTLIHLVYIVNIGVDLFNVVFYTINHNYAAAIAWFCIGIMWGWQIARDIMDKKLKRAYDALIKAYRDRCIALEKAYDEMRDKANSIILSNN